jgi:type IV pilus assembly protein PilA
MQMDGEQDQGIRFFHASSRIGRLRYFAYGMGLFALALPVLVLAGILFAFQMAVLGGLLLAAAYIFMLTMGVVFGVRRLHDLDRTGWWMLITPVSIACTFAHVFHLLPGSLFWLYGLTTLISFVFYLVLLFAPGTQADNRFGAPPPPNTGWVVFGAWSFLIVPFFGGILAAIAIPAYQDYIARSQMSEGIQLAGGAEIPVSEYFKNTKTWPAELQAVYAVAGEDPAGRYVATVTGNASGDSYGVIATMKTSGVNSRIAGRSVELWTTDGGETWYCGPGGADPVEPRYLPSSCRDDSAP